MPEELNLTLILAASVIAAASPGPATLAIANASMSSGRKSGLALAFGISTGSLTWAFSAALGLGALMHANAWAFDIARYVGASYLLYLAYKSARSAISPSKAFETSSKYISPKKAYAKGLAIHLTNPKAVLFFGSLFSIGLPANPSIETILIVIGAVCTQGITIFITYALLFSSKPMVLTYNKLKRWFEAFFALAFGAAGTKILSSSIE
ncbi:LysE family translocator [Curvivirga aplysinae]|uniref:LysE family translocator n=1 Tax=Curvivirga aplysinae TaxID=2529852 RepID=UPI0012BCFD32|nr:LysE family translocator [Curvivirga aplysinae]MTI09069.1 LysE family translocator [Curvivirga aplysinae]